MTQIIEEVDWATLIDFESDVVCEAIIECNKSAVWRIRLSCCGYSHLLCDNCVKELEGWLAETESIGKIAICEPCGAKIELPTQILIRPHVRL